MGDGHHQPDQAAPDRGAALSGRARLRPALAALAAALLALVVFRLADPSLGLATRSALALAVVAGAAWLGRVWATRGPGRAAPRPASTAAAAAVGGEPETLARARSRRLDALTRLTQVLTATLSVDEVLALVVAAPVELLESSVARLWLLEDDGEHLALRAESSAPAAAPTVRRLRLGEGLVGWIAAHREPLRLPDLLDDPRLRNAARLREEGVVSFAGVPLRAGDRVLGVLAVATRRRHEYTAEEMAVLQSLADHAAIAIENARLFAEERARRAYLAAVLDINTKIGALVSTETLLRSIAEEAARLLNVDNAGFRLLEGEELVLAGLAGTARDTMLVERLRVGQSLSGRVVQQGRTLTVSLEAAAGDVVPEHLAADRRLGYTTFLGVPLRFGERTIGVLTFRARRAFTARDIELAEAFAGQAAVALEHARLYREAADSARRMRALADVGRLLSETLDDAVVGQRVVDAVCGLLGARSAALYRPQDGDELGLVAESQPGGVFTWTPALPPGAGVAGLAVRERAPVATADALADGRIDYPPALQARLRANEHRALLAVPIRVRDRLFGVLAVADRTGRRFDGEEIRLAQAFADAAGLALANAQLFAAERARAARLRTLARLNHHVTSSLDLDDVLATIARAAGEIMGVPFVAVWVLDDDGQRLHMRAFWGAPADAPFQVTALRVGEGVVGAAAAERRTVDVGDLFEDGRFIGRDWARLLGFRSVRAMPILHRDALLGVLVLAAPAPIQVAAAEEADLLDAFTAQAAAAIHNARLYQEARANADRLRALEEVNRLVSSSLNVEEVLRNLARAVARFFDSPFVSVWSYDLARRRLHRAITHGDAALMARLNDELAEGEGAVGWVVQHCQPILGADVAMDRRVANAAELLEVGLRWLTCYPIAIGDRMLGAFTVHQATLRAATPEAESLMGSLAAQAAIALENARLYAETTRRLTETRSLLEVAEVLNSTLDLTLLLKRVTIKVAQVCRVDRCSIELFDGDRVVPAMAQFADGRREPAMWAAFRDMRPYAPGDVPLHARAIETRAPVAVEDVAASDAVPRAWATVYGMRACLAVPLLRQDRVIGVMNLDYCDRPRPFADWQRDLAMAVGGQLALALENGRLYTEVQARLRETTALLGVGRVLSQPGVGEDTMRQLAAEVARSFGADMVGAYTLDPERQVLVPVGGYHVPKHLLDFFRDRPLSLARSPRLAAACRSGRAIGVSDVHADPELDADWTRTLPPFATLFVPTVAHGAAVGGLFLVWWRPGRPITPAELRLAEGVAAQVGLAMENADLARQTRVRLQETETLLSVSRALSSTLDLETLVRHFLRVVARAVGADCVGSWLLREDGEWLEPLAGYHVPPERLAALRALRVSVRHHAFYAEAAASRRPVFTDDAMADPRLPRHVLEAGPHRSQLFVPVLARDRMIAGFAAVWWERSRRFTPAELALMEAIGSQAGVALENAQLFAENRRRVEELSVLHELSRAVTGQLDRAALLEAIRSQVARVLDISNLVVLLRNDERGVLEVALRIVDGVPDTREPREYAQGGVGLMSVVLESGVALRSADYAADCARYGVAPVAESAARRHWLGVPMRAGESVLGVLVLRSRDRAFTEADERLLINIGQLAALALRSARLFEERTRALTELRAAQDQLVRTEKLRALGEMASGVAHDFNNLLASVLGRAQLLLRRVHEPQQRQWLQVIERAALDGAQTVRRLQEFTRIRRDQPLVPLDLAGVVRDALEITQSRWRDEPHSRGVTVDVRTALDPVAPVAGDAAELREAMTNLILNALDAMPDGGVLTLATTMVDEDHVRVTVSDTGVGMAPEVRERIFDPFFTTKGPQGTGLGLSMTYGIVSRHNASIEVESAPGKGTTFRLTFERARAPAPPPPAAAEPAPPVRALRCLVVDDEEPVGSVLGDILAAAGHTVAVVVDGAEAIERIRAERFDLVFTDLAMPRVSGWQVARAVKAIAPRVPVVLVSGFGVELTSEAQRAHGVDAVLVKPLQIQDVLDAVAAMARTHA